jgi:hypothetical protein
VSDSPAQHLPIGNAEPTLVCRVTALYYRLVDFISISCLHSIPCPHDQLTMSQSEAQRRAEARRAKILARGSAGLAKLASTARGEEASVLYDSESYV